MKAIQQNQNYGYFLCPWRYRRVSGFAAPSKMVELHKVFDAYCMHMHAQENIVLTLKEASLFRHFFSRLVGNVSSSLEKITCLLFME